MVDASTPSQYSSPWTVLLGASAKLTGLGPFTLLRVAALASLTLLGTGVWQFTRTFTRHRSAPALALLCLLLLWGPLRTHRDRRDPLVVFFALGAMVVAAGAASGHWWSRTALDSRASAAPG
ncbi:hypothetical protein [Streptomyces sp. NRRL S-920]|uniref:hypothetical protein n=1 Tax=Streptomyces sp. NRRL S-920 TaxID=1463921 RepID=UPI0004C4CEFD|nr:hypothetical protein [Streptomyces sp. NRRL S-920]